MGTASAVVAPASGSRLRIWLGVLLVIAGLCGHLFAARAIGGYYIAYRDHIGGFVLIALVTGAIILPLGWRFWKRRPDIAVLTLGATQAIVGFVIYLFRYHV
ncbi:MAG TPA: hypothetical protein VJO33_05310 [Gemmatimonadaceae bacterium]|nr:hypothetical protein [Gemmatimonadaceae bacterium]